jgi:hypothetical protein
MLSRKLIYGILVPTVAVWLAIALAPDRVQIRVDCGDLRHTAFGIPVRYEPMVEPERSRLLAATAGSSVVSPTWVPVVPQTTSHYNAGVYQSWYRAAGAFGSLDMSLCRLMAEDFGSRVIAAKGHDYVVPSWPPDMRFTDPAASGTAWATDPGIGQFCRAHGYSIESGQKPGDRPHLVPLP